MYKLHGTVLDMSVEERLNCNVMTCVADIVLTVFSKTVVVYFFVIYVSCLHCIRL